jgi:hypothetical protein
MRLMRTTVGWIVGGLAMVCVACSSNGGNGTTSSAATTEKANPCATKGATYLETATEQSGNCGQIPSQVININPDGTLTTSVAISCAMQTQTGCKAQITDCTWTANGYSYSETGETTFASDGSSATGLVTITAMGNGQSCSSTYSVTFMRQ